MDQANVKKICSSCMTKHNFSLNMVTKSQLCNLCEKSVEAENFQDHLVEHEMENGTISCAVCSSIFTSIAGLKGHIRDHNLTAMDLKEVCAKCNSRFLYHSELLHHLQEHELGGSQPEPAKQEDEIVDVVKAIKEEEDDDYIEIEKVVESSV